MTHARQTRMLQSKVCAVALGTSILVLAGCALEVGPAYPGIEYDSYPPDGYIATSEPFYFEGRATYWYGGNWYYRDGGRWNHYNSEPRGLYQRRMQAAPMRRSYEPSRARRGYPAAGHSGSRSERRR